MFAMMWFILFAILLEWSCGNTMPWSQRQTIATSMKKNIVGQCKFTMGKQSNDTIPVDTFLVIPMIPAPYERRRHFNRTLPNWTHGNKEMSDYFVAKGLGYDKMGQETGMKWMFHEEHPGQNRNMCIALTLPVGQGEPVDMYKGLKKDTYRPPYLAIKKHVVVHPQGFVMSDCGYFQGYEGCETRYRDIVGSIHSVCQMRLNKQDMTIGSYFNHKPRTGLASVTERLQSIVSGQQKKVFNEVTYLRILSKCTIDDDHYNMTNSGSLFQPKFYKRVFVITGLWDINYHHFLVDSLSRLARYIDFLKSNPDVYIHIRAHEYKYHECAKNVDCVKGGVLMRNRFFQLLGIDVSRIVYGVVLAEEVYIPRVPGCGFALASSLDIRLLGDLILTGAYDAAPEYAKKQAALGKKNLIIQQRFNEETVLRYWSDADTRTIELNFARRFPKHSIIRQSSKSIHEADYCFACDVIDYANADILVGLHGAGLTNMIFMPPGGVVVEVFGDALDLYMTLCGYTGPLTASVGHSHYMHSYQHEEGRRFVSAACAQEVKNFYVSHVQRQPKKGGMAVVADA